MFKITATEAGGAICLKKVAEEKDCTPNSTMQDNSRS